MKTQTQVTPIKRHSALVELSREHHFGLLLVWKIKQGLKKQIQPERISNYVLFFFEQDLEKHFTEEENVWFARLAADDELKIQAMNEHKAIYSLIAHLRADKSNVDALNELADALEKHIRFEERVLFNHLQNNLSADELKNLPVEQESSKTDVDEQWDDHFWGAI